MSASEPAQGRVDDVVAALLARRAELRREGATPLGGRVVLIGDTGDAEVVAAALMRTGVQELSLVGPSEALAAVGARLSREHPSRRVSVVADDELEPVWRSAHGVVDVRSGAELAELPLARSWLPAGAWSVRCAVTAEGVVVEAVD